MHSADRAPAQPEACGAVPGPHARLVATRAARALVAALQAEHGSLMFHQAGSECATSLPLCFAQGDFPLVEMDVLLGDVDGAPFYVSHRQFRCFARCRVQLDAEPGRAGVFSLERPTGLRFVTRLLRQRTDAWRVAG